MSLRPLLVWSAGVVFVAAFGLLGWYAVTAGRNVLPWPVLLPSASLVAITAVSKKLKRCEAVRDASFAMCIRCGYEFPTIGADGECPVCGQMHIAEDVRLTVLWELGDPLGRRCDSVRNYAAGVPSRLVSAHSPPGTVLWMCAGFASMFVGLGIGSLARPAGLGMWWFFLWVFIGLGGFLACFSNLEHWPRRLRAACEAEYWMCLECGQEMDRADPSDICPECAAPFDFEATRLRVLRCLGPERCRAKAWKKSRGGVAVG